MHMLIRGLVYAESASDALTNAKYDVFRPLLEERAFDYYVTADMDGQGVAGTDRWGPYPTAVTAESTRGEALLEEGWDATVNEYERQFDRVQDFFDSTDDVGAFWEDEAVHREYHGAFNAIGEYSGPHTWLYDQDGVGIRDRSHLDSVLNHWADAYIDETPYEPDLYVVPADIHY